MNFWESFQLGLREIWAHKFRSLLTMLGIILGVSSLVAMSALVKGMERGAKEALIAVGGLQKVRVEEADVPVEQHHLRDQAVGVTMKDVHALRNSAPLVTGLSPNAPANATLTANGRRFRPFICVGVWPIALSMTEHVLAHGRMFNEIDDEQARSGLRDRDRHARRVVRLAGGTWPRGHPDRRDDPHQPPALHDHWHVPTLRE